MPADPTRPDESSTSADSSHLILIRALHPGLSPQDPACYLGERCTAEVEASIVVKPERCLLVRENPAIPRCSRLIASRESSLSLLA